MVEGQQRTLEGATDNLTDDLESSDAGKNMLTTCWTNSGLDKKTVTAPGFDAGLKEFTKDHEAQSRKVKNDDETLDMTAPTDSIHHHHHAFACQTAPRVTYHQLVMAATAMRARRRSATFGTTCWNSSRSKGAAQRYSGAHKRKSSARWHWRATSGRTLFFVLGVGEQWSGGVGASVGGSATIWVSRPW